MNEALKMIIFCKYLLLAQKCRYITCTHKKNYKIYPRFQNLGILIWLMYRKKLTLP